MAKTSGTLKTTVLGGLVFLIPFAILLVLVAKVYEVMAKIAAPIAARIGVEQIGGVAVINFVTIAVTLAACYVAGRIATSRWGQRAYRRLDERMLDIFPRYGFVKAMASGLGEQADKTLPVVLVRFDDQSQLAFEVERRPDQVVVFLPGSPDPWSGAVSFVTPDRVTAVDANFNATVRTMRLAGRGALKLLQ